MCVSVCVCVCVCVSVCLVFLYVGSGFLGYGNFCETFLWNIVAPVVYRTILSDSMKMYYPKSENVSLYICLACTSSIYLYKFVTSLKHKGKQKCLFSPGKSFEKGIRFP